MSNQIQVPNNLLEQSGYSLKIIQNNDRLFWHIDYLRQLVTNIHNVYTRLCKHMMTLSEDYDRKILNRKCTSNFQVCIRQQIAYKLLNQLNNNNVALGTKTYRIARTRLDILRVKLMDNDRTNQDYLQKVHDYNKSQREFEQKCEYFNDYEHDVLKYYSLKVNSELYEKLSQKQLRLKQKQQNIYQMKNDYKMGIGQIRTQTKEYYEMEKHIVSDYKRLLQNIRRDISSNKIYNQPILQEDNEDANSSHIFENGLIRRTDRGIKERSVHLNRKEIIRQYQKYLEVEELFEEFLNLMQTEISRAGEGIDEIRSAKGYQKFNGDKILMLEILSSQSIKDIDFIINQISLFRTIILNLSIIFGKTKVLKELKRYRGFNFQKYMEDTNHFSEMQKKNPNSPEIFADYKTLEQKFEASHVQYMTRFKQKINDLQRQIIRQYSRQQQTYEQQRNKMGFKNDLFEKKHYEILMLPFFLPEKDCIKYFQNKYLKKFSALVNANQVQKMLTLQGFRNQKGGRTTTSCCGLIKNQSENTFIDQYNCALKDGLILIQGKLKLYENYLSFKSSFNSKTLFGNTDLRIPKWDIIEFVKDKHLISMMLIVVSNHGNLQFTSFLSNPMDKLIEIYDNRKSCASVIVKKSGGYSELQYLEERFQSEFHVQLMKNGIIIDKLSTYLTEDSRSLSISIEYHQNGTNSTYYFQIKIMQLKSSIEYLFIQDQNYRSGETKSRLEKVSKQLINRKQQPLNKGTFLRASNPNMNELSFQFQYSMIEPRELNKISFIKQPSFMNGKKNESLILQKNLQGLLNRTQDKFQLNCLLSSRQLISTDHKIQDPSVRKSSQKQEKQFNILSSQMFIPDQLVLHPSQNSNDEFRANLVKNKERRKRKGSLGSKASGLSKETRQSGNSKSKPMSLSQYRKIIYFLGVLFIANLMFKLAS